MYDPRAIANCIIEFAGERGISCSNLKLQKLLYFVHGTWLVKYNEPLCIGAFEAWQHGPVHPVVYEAFRSFGSENIFSRASAFDPISRTRSEIPMPNDIRVLDLVRSILSSMGHLSGSQLRNLTHAKDGPWSIVVEGAVEKANVGLKIPNDVIRSNFGNLNENAPYS
jgi:uncharacterized phage-associated protein